MKSKMKDTVIIYLTECALATVEELAQRKLKTKSDVEKHIGIAQIAVSFIRDLKIKINPNLRVYEVLSQKDQKVQSWYKSIS